jgi:hypothetical protein
MRNSIIRNIRQRTFVCCSGIDTANPERASDLATALILNLLVSVNFTCYQFLHRCPLVEASHVFLTTCAGGLITYFASYQSASTLLSPTALL